jgi:hypothetical protein
LFPRLPALTVYPCIKRASFGLTLPLELLGELHAPDAGCYVFNANGNKTTVRHLGSAFIAYLFCGDAMIDYFRCEGRLSAAFLLEGFDALFVWWLGELAAPSAIVSDVFRPFQAIHVLHLNFPPRQAIHTGFLDEYKGLFHARAGIEQHFVGTAIVWSSHYFVV